MKTLSKKQISNRILDQIILTSKTEFEFFQIYKNAKGTRFTSLGFNIAKKIWSTYTVKLAPNYKILNRTLLMLDERMDWPYYLSKTQLVLFSEMDAFEHTLYSGDINLWSNK